MLSSSLVHYPYKLNSYAEALVNCEPSSRGFVGVVIIHLHNDSVSLPTRLLPPREQSHNRTRLQPRKRRSIHPDDPDKQLRL
jgi:hypothetical protein